MSDDRELPADDNLGGLGVAHVARMFARVQVARTGTPPPGWTTEDIERDRLVIDGLGLGREPTMQHLWRRCDTLAAFESWVLDQKGGVLDPTAVTRVNAAILGTAYDEQTTAWLAAVEAAPAVLDDADLQAWSADGYVVVHDAIDGDACQAAERVVWDYLGSSPDDPASWYSEVLNGIMVQLFQHPALDVARRSPRIHKAFAQLWGTADLFATTDRCGFNPPETHGWHYPGPPIHWDVLLTPPVDFDTSGILYLTDTAADQGAFACVPGFHREIDDWLLADPARQNRNPPPEGAFEASPIAGRAGDLIIWNGALPHASSPNRANRPRIVQYLTMAPPV